MLQGRCITLFMEEAFAPDHRCILSMAVNGYALDGYPVCPTIHAMSHDHCHQWQAWHGPSLASLGFLPFNCPKTRPF